jgi:hypothetical protein
MTKKTKIVYVYLALFAFTLGFSFTLASQAQADIGGCCVYEWCYYYNPPHVGAWGHLVKGVGCVFDGMDPDCDVAYECPEN